MHVQEWIERNISRARTDSIDEWHEAEKGLIYSVSMDVNSCLMRVHCVHSAHTHMRAIILRHSIQLSVTFAVDIISCSSCLVWGHLLIYLSGFVPSVWEIVSLSPILFSFLWAEASLAAQFSIYVSIVCWLLVWLLPHSLQCALESVALCDFIYLFIFFSHSS